jgi:tRNA threonylcarbamoyladenosine biosynthesis protein TsaB
VPDVLALLEEAGCTLSDLDAIAFGQGPGAFTGLRTACAVAQGLAFGANKPALPVDSLMAVAEDAWTRAAPAASGSPDAPCSVWVAMDARMNEIYAAHYIRQGSTWHTEVAPMLTTADALSARWRNAPPHLLAGSALAVFGDALQVDVTQVRCVPEALPRAVAMLPLAQQLWAAGGAVDAALALPVYVRDKVAQTTQERDAARAAKEDALRRGDLPAPGAAT